MKAKGAGPSGHLRTLPTRKPRDARCLVQLLLCSTSSNLAGCRAAGFPSDHSPVCCVPFLPQPRPAPRPREEGLDLKRTHTCTQSRRWRFRCSYRATRDFDIAWIRVSPEPEGGCFATTAWTLVLHLGRQGSCLGLAPSAPRAAWCCGPVHSEIEKLSPTTILYPVDLRLDPVSGIQWKGEGDSKAVHHRLSTIGLPPWSTHGWPHPGMPALYTSC